MQKGRSVQYVAAGVQDIPGVHIRVRSNVCLPDSEAGQADGAYRQPFHAESVRQAPRGAMTVPMNAAMIFLCLLFVFFGVMALKKAVARAELTKRIDAMESGIAQTEMDNRDLAAQVAEARDPARIGYAASQKLDMSAPAGVTPEWVVAPDTRPFEQKNAAQADASPYSALEGKITGSR